MELKDLIMVKFRGSKHGIYILLCFRMLNVTFVVVQQSWVIWEVYIRGYLRGEVIDWILVHYEQQMGRRNLRNNFLKDFSVKRDNMR